MAGTYGLKNLERRAVAAAALDYTHYPRQEHSVVRAFLYLMAITVENGGQAPATPDLSTVLDNIFITLKYMKSDRSYCVDMSARDLWAAAQALGYHAIPDLSAFEASVEAEADLTIPFPVIVPLSDLRSPYGDGEVDLIEIESLRLRLPAGVDVGTDFTITNIDAPLFMWSRDGALYGQRRFLEFHDDARSAVDLTGPCPVNFALLRFTRADGDVLTTVKADGTNHFESVSLLESLWNWPQDCSQEFNAANMVVPIDAGNGVTRCIMQLPDFAYTLLFGGQVNPSTIKAAVAKLSVQLSAAPATPGHYIAGYLEPVEETLSRRAPTQAEAVDVAPQLVAKGVQRNPVTKQVTQAVSDSVNRLAPRLRRKGY